MILNMGYQIELHVMLMLNWVMTLPTDNLGFFCIYQYCSFLTVFFVLAFNIHLVPVAKYTFSMLYPILYQIFLTKFCMLTSNKRSDGRRISYILQLLFSKDHRFWCISVLYVHLTKEQALPVSLDHKWTINR